MVRRTRGVSVHDMTASCECFRNGALSDEAWSESGHGIYVKIIGIEKNYLTRSEGVL